MSRKAKWIIGVIAVFFAVVLAILVPLSLSEKGERRALALDPTVGPTVVPPTASALPLPVKVSTTQTLQGKRYENTTAGYSLIVPSGWVVSGSAAGYTIFLVPEAGKGNDSFLPRFRAQMTVTGSQTSEQLILNLTGETSVNGPPTWIESTHPVDVDGLQGTRWIYTDQQDQIRRVYVVIDRGTVFYWFGGTGLTVDWERDFPIFEEILASIAFTEVPNIAVRTPESSPEPTATPTSTPIPRSSKQSPEEVLFWSTVKSLGEAFYAARAGTISFEEYAAVAYDAFSSRAKGLCPKEVFVSGVGVSTRENFGIADAELLRVLRDELDYFVRESNVDISGNRAQVTRQQSDHYYVVNAPYILEDGAWRIDPDYDFCPKN